MHFLASRVARVFILTSVVIGCSDDAARRRPQRDDAGADAAAGGRNATGGSSNGGAGGGSSMGGAATGGSSAGGAGTGGSSPVNTGGTGNRDAGSSTSDAAATDASARDGASDAQKDAGASPPVVYDPGTGLTPDQACPAWAVADSAEPEDPVVTNGVLVTSTDVLAEGMSFHLTYAQTVTSLPATVVVEIDARFVNKAATGGRTGSLFGFQLQGGAFSQTFTIDDGEFYLLQDSALGKGPSYSAPTSDSFHTYRLEGDAATRVVRVYRDGVLVITHTAIAVAPLYPVFFGDGTSGGAGTTEWRRISHNLLAPGVCSADASL